MGMMTGREKKLLSIVGVLLVAVLLFVVYLVAGMISAKPNLPSQITNFTPQGTVGTLTVIVYVEFSEQMDSSSVEGAFSLTISGTKLTGTFTWYEMAMRFDPNSSLVDGKEYVVKIDKSARTLSGIPLDHDFTWTFYTPSLSRSIVGLMPIAFISVFLLLLFFVYIEYSYYRMWSSRMKMRYGSKFDENEHDFLPLFRRRKKLKRGMVLEKGSWGTLYDNGLFANFIFEKHKSIRPEYKSYSEIEAIYPFSLGEIYTHSKKKMYDGIQIESRDFKVCLFNSTMHPLKAIVPVLVSEFGDRWESVFKKDVPVDRKRLGIHHWTPEEKK